MTVESRMREKLMISLRPTRLDVVNESSHFRVLIVSEAFSGKSRVERHRIVNDLLSNELKNAVHALAIKACAPGEATG